MKVWYDREVDILYISLKKGPAYDSEELSPDVRVEYDEKGKLIGIEVMNARINVFNAIAKEIATHLKETITTKIP
ncbi:MAG: DUF2283 domain-containing protein [Candidatus Bathyarchaeia archaeon]|nr:DUF2283 domain-containing protein [Candidatus Bathyarchaeia archaeon]